MTISATASAPVAPAPDPAYATAGSGAPNPRFDPRIPRTNTLTARRILLALTDAALALSRWYGHLPDDDLLGDQVARSFTCTRCGAWTTVTISHGEPAAINGAATSHVCGYRESAYADRPDRGSLIGSPAGEYGAGD